jgi:formate dehydrogenase major subunit
MEMARRLDDADTPVGGTFWIYSGNATYTAGWDKLKTDMAPAGQGFGAWTVTNRAKSRNGSIAGPANTYSRYGWSWLLNRRVFYNNGEVPGDVADVFVAPTVLARLFVIDSNTLSDYSLLYRAYNTLKDKPDTGIGAAHKYPGRFPAHTEPYETQYDGTDASKANLVSVWGQNTKGTGAGDLVPHVAGRADLDTLRGQAKDFPLLLTTIRCVEHFQGGPITRNNPWNVELEPEPWIELNSVDARKYGIANGDWVNITTARSNSTTDQLARTRYTNDPSNVTDNFGKGFRARVGVGLQSNQRVPAGIVAIPWHWGDRGLSTGARANDLCIDASDANTQIPEYKACLCKIEKA